MKIFDYFNKKISKLNWKDITALKWLTFLVGMVAGAFFPAFVLGNLTIFIILIAVLYVLLLRAFFWK
ncbi:MAG: hypothetical protein ACTSXQ_05920 [Alphaproteobacteria bacterium]